MRIEANVEVKLGDVDEGLNERTETYRLVAEVDAENVTIIEPGDYRFLTASEQRQLFDAACIEAERQERASAESKRLCDDFLAAARLSRAGVL